MKTRDYYRTERGRISKMHTKMRERAARKNLSLMSKQDFLAWSLSSTEFYRLFELWVRSGFKMRLVPTVDRVDNALGYQAGNVQFLTHGKNVAKGNREVPRKGGGNKKRILLVRETEERFFTSGKAACMFLGFCGRSAICRAARGQLLLRGWEVRYA